MHYLLLLFIFLMFEVAVGIFLFDTSLNSSGIQYNVDTNSDIVSFLPFLLAFGFYFSGTCSLQMNNLLHYDRYTLLCFIGL